MRPIRIVAVVVSLAALAVAAFAGPETVRDDVHHCSFERPSAWPPLDSKFVDDMRRMKEQSKLRVEWVDAFGAPKGADGRRYPYVTVGFDPWKSPLHTYDGLAKEFSRDSLDAASETIAAKKGGSSTPTRHDDPVIDRQRGRISYHATMSMPSVPEIDVYNVGLVGKDGILWLHAYARPREAAAAWPLVDAAADSFRWDAGYEFHENEFLLAVGWMRWVKIGLAVAALIAVAAVFVVRVLRKRRSEEPPPLA